MELRYCCCAARSLPALSLYRCDRRPRSTSVIPLPHLLHSDPKLPKLRSHAGFLKSSAFQDNLGFVSNHVIVAPDQVEQAQVSKDQLGSEYIISYTASSEKDPEGNTTPDEAIISPDQVDFKDEAICTDVEDTIASSEVICTNVEDTVVRSEVMKLVSNEANQVANLLKKLNLKLDSGSYVLFTLGAGGVIALWLSSAILEAIDSIPLFPKLMELFGLGFTIWFSSKYLFLKESRDELTAKIDDLKEQIIGSLEE